MSLRRVEKGFTLLEAAMAMVVLVLVVASFTGVFERVLQTDQTMEEKANMANIYDSMKTFLSVNRYLPCPDTDADGLENRQDSGGVSVCSSREGGLPFNDLGVSEKDAWGNPYYYRVHQRAENANYVNEICEPASVLGESGPRGKSDLWLCPESNLYYCTSQSNCNGVCSASCTNSTDPRPTSGTTEPPFFHLATPPYGTISGSYNLDVHDAAGQPMGEGIVAVVVSWGQNGHRVNRANCSGGSAQEMENCDNDATFMGVHQGEGYDLITWISVDQAKVTLIGTGAFR